VLLEVMVALTILATAGISLATVMSSALENEDRLARREETLANAERVLSASTLLTRIELDLRLGRHVVGEFIVDVQRPEKNLYRLAVLEAGAPDLETLVTVVYRPER
jgi:type II secretory pathway component PulJ